MTTNLTVSRTQTTWSFRKNRIIFGFVNGQVVAEVVAAFEQAKIDVIGKPETYPAPTVFKDIVFNRRSLGANLGTGTTHLPFAAYAKLSGASVDVSLGVMTFGGTGTIADPYVGPPVSVASGDTFTVEGVGISKPRVTGLAANSVVGGWMVDSYTSTDVTFIATNDVTLTAGQLISGFSYDDTPGVFPTGENWVLVSSIEESNSQGLVQPMP